MYLKVDGDYARSAHNLEDWSTDLPINQNDRVEMCAYLNNMDKNWNLIGQHTFFRRMKLIYTMSIH